MSYEHDALFFNVDLGWLGNLFGGAVDNIVDGIVNGGIVSPGKYDYYIKSHDGHLIPNIYAENAQNSVLHEYKGYDFCNEIIQVINGYGGHDTDELNNINKLALNQKVKSAIEYCYNKNKRYENGQVVKDKESNPQNLNWYLPAVDEIEQIVMSTYEDGSGAPRNTYGRFLDFQNKFYWSSQPSYIPNYAHDNQEYWIIFPFDVDYYGDFFFDDYGQARYDQKYNTDRYRIGSARATKVKYDNGEYSYTTSGAQGYDSYYDYDKADGNRFSYSGSVNGKTIGTITRDDGNKARNDMARVRCVRKQPTT